MASTFTLKYFKLPPDCFLDLFGLGFRNLGFWVKGDVATGEGRSPLQLCQLPLACDVV